MDRYPSDLLDKLARVYARAAVDAYIEEQTRKMGQPAAEHPQAAAEPRRTDDDRSARGCQ